MIKKITIYSSVLLLLLSLFSIPVLAAEENDISAEELGIEEPGVLSWFKDTFDTVQLWFTQDLVKKSEIELRKANRQIIKIKEFIQNNSEDENLQNRFNELDGKYQNLINNINSRIEEFKEENNDSDKFNSFLDKYTNHQMLHQEIMKKLEDQVPEEAMGKIQQKRQEHLENFGEVMNKLQEREEFKERLGNILNDEQQRNEIRVRAMETIEELEEISGEEIKETIQELKLEKKEIFQELNNINLENPIQQQTNTSNQGEDYQLQNQIQVQQQGSDQGNGKRNN